MVQEYATKFYLPNFETVQAMNEDNMKEGLAYTNWRSRLNEAWKFVKVRDVKISQTQIKVGSNIEVTAMIDLGQLTPKDVRVQVYYGKLTTLGTISEQAEAVNMTSSGVDGNGTCKFSANVTYDTSGERGLSVRVMPYHPYLHTSFIPGMITWAG